MTTTREDVLLQIPEVRFKKGDGVLYVMNERIAWIATNRNTFAVSHFFKDIKSKFDILLRLVKTLMALLLLHSAKNFA
jgi:hypothetical protein